MPKKPKANTLATLAGMAIGAGALYFWTHPEQIVAVINSLKEMKECQKTQIKKQLKKSEK